MRTLITLLLAALALGACGEKKKSHTEEAAENIGKSGGKSDLHVGDRFLEVPPFKLLERAGVPVSNETLKGKVWVATFIFTTCKTSCLPMCSQMYHLQEEFKDEPDFVCVATTVDPANDTPEVLRSFAKSYSAREGKWLFLTGEREAIRVFAHEGLKITWQKEEPLIHSTKFVLVDRDGWIRGWFDGTDRDSVAELKKIARKVLAEKSTS
jgi:protein SCO1/2